MNLKKCCCGSDAACNLKNDMKLKSSNEKLKHEIAEIGGTQVEYKGLIFVLE